MNNKFPTFFRFLAILVLSLTLSGCANKPFLTPDNTYAIVTTSTDGKVQSTPVSLPWNTNQAVLQRLLVEASFVLSDLHTLNSSTQSSSPNIKPNSGPTTFLMTNFPESKKLMLNIDGLAVNMDVQSIQIEVQGSDIGRVVLNESWTLQGISDPNLSPAFLDFLTMLQRQKDSDKGNLISTEQNNQINPSKLTNPTNSADQTGTTDQKNPPDQTNPTDQTYQTIQTNKTVQINQTGQIDVVNTNN